MNVAVSEPLTSADSPQKDDSQEHGKLTLSISGLEKSFQGTPVLRGVALNAHAGDAIALVGSNGSGKSTLLRCCMRLIEPDSGTITLFEKDVCSLSGGSLRAVRSRVGFVFQKHNLVPRVSALTNVIHGAQGKSSSPRLWFQGFAPQALREKALQCLQEVGLAHLAARPVDKLSGGQSQRVAIARALMQDPEIILADEPVASLDPEAGDQVMELLRQLAKQKGIALIFSTHHLEHALHFADRVIGLQRGVIELDKPSSELSIPDLRSFYEPS